MANFSDDDANETVDTILGQRKRKGALEYLVKWKGDGDKNESWESVTSFSSGNTKAIETFLEKKKSEKKRSTSKSRKASRSRSRSSSRSRKLQGKSRSRSRGRPKKPDSTSSKVETSEEVGGNSTVQTPSKNTRSRRSLAVTESIITSSSSLENSVDVTDSKSSTEANMSSKSQLEVQRVHNERCFVRDDDKKPRSIVWQVADYAVLALFVLSTIAGLFLFLEKMFDLEEFKSQAFPNMELLKVRLVDGFNSLYESAFHQLEKIGDLWLYLSQQPQKST